MVAIRGLGVMRIGRNAVLEGCFRLSPDRFYLGVMRI